MLIIRQYTDEFITLCVGDTIECGVQLRKIKDVKGYAHNIVTIISVSIYHPASIEEINQYLTDEEILELL